MNERLRKIAERGKKDYYFFTKEILNYRKMTQVPHQEVCDHILKPGRHKKLILMPRGSFKSSVVTVAGTMFFLLQDPNERILIASETQRNAIKFVKEIKGHYEANEKFRALYGNWVNEDNTWRDSEIIVSKRALIRKESSVTASSLEKQTITGQHYSRIFLDDVVSRNTTQNEDQIEKTLDYYKLLLSILDPGGYLYVCGTRWSYLDLYSWIEAEDNPERNQFDILVKPAIDQNDNLLMPHVLSREFLEQQKQTQGETIFNHQYLLQATSTDEQTFRPEWVEFYEKAPSGLYYFISVDPAISLESDSDYTGIIVNGVDWHHDWYIHEAIQERLQPSDIIDLIFRLCEKYQPMMCLGLEKFMLEKMLKIPLFEEMQKRKKYIPIKDVETDNRVSKEHRIRGLQPRFQAEQIFLKKEHKKLYHQILMHPMLKHDDVLDALKTQLYITFPGEKGEEEVKLNTGPLSQKEKEIWDEVKDLGKRRVVVRSEIEL